MTESNPFDATGDFDSTGPEPETQESRTIQAPDSIGRYHVERLLGEGGFGIVYLARDEQLERLVAIKVPHARKAWNSKTTQSHVDEARAVANLDHPNIVPVYDVGETDEFPFFVVSKFIDGITLSAKAKQSRPSLRYAATLIATIARAVHHAHKFGVVHRDIKPGNILIDDGGIPHLVDFGLALRDQDIGKGPKQAGTPGYMSPEQARGEGHRVDGRSDVFSLGVVLYELLVARRPFRGDSSIEILHEIITSDPRPPRQIDDKIPGDLERICLKAMAKRATDRYTTAADLAEELQLFIDEQTIVDSSRIGVSDLSDPMAPTTVKDEGGTSSEGSASWTSEPLRIVPKGLRSFDEHDSDFFLELLPGARDRAGLPDSIRFWKTQLDEIDSDKTSAVGLLYGPSGCGKSSLVKAGLIPRLADHTIPIYVEATPDETESRLLRGIRKCFPGVANDGDLKSAIASLRLGNAIPSGSKAVLILDQFEQWLYSREEGESELVDALRQCDGGRVQCVLMVRDDFWMATTRLMQELEIRLVEGQNSAAVDLFQPRHARKVLLAFGRAFGDLPEDVRQISKSNNEFLDRAIQGLAQNGTVVCVRLALFAQMMKGKSWTVATLKEVGGTEGVGSTFLEETFSANTAPPKHRYHEGAARGVLNALLPASGTDLKGHMRSREDLFEAAGYAKRPQDFEDLLLLLDKELRLIAPTDPEGLEADDSIATLGERYFQLTHDYLVPSLREWLNRKQKGTARGRAELRLHELAAFYQARPEKRRLPSWWEWIRLSALTASSKWTDGEGTMMRAATRSHSTWALGIMIAIGLAGWGIYELSSRTRAHALVESLTTAETGNVSALIDKLEANSRWADGELRELLDDSPVDSTEHVHAGLALLNRDPNQLEYLRGRLLEVEIPTLLVMRDELAPHRTELSEWLWEKLDDQSTPVQQRFRSALVLAAFDPPTASNQEHWEQHVDFIASQLVDTTLSRPGYYSMLTRALEPAKSVLLSPLSDVFLDVAADRRRMATGILVEYAADNADALAQLVMDANENQFPVVFSLLEAHSAGASARLLDELGKSLAEQGSSRELEHCARRQANAAVALMLLGESSEAWELLRHSTYPHARSHLIHRMRPLGVAADRIANRLDAEADLSSRRALLLALGEFQPDELSDRVRDRVIDQTRERYKTDPDAGMHAAAEWLLRTWEQEIPEAPISERPENPEDLAWYVTRQGHMMVALNAEAVPSIGHRFEIAAKEVTVKQFKRSQNRYWVNKEISSSEDCAAGVITWYRAVSYCQWLNEANNIPEEEWCYPRIDGSEGTLPSFEADISRTGYRLPTPAEREFALLAGAEASRYYGDSNELLGNYSWFRGNSDDHIRPGGLKKPNDWGLFDMLGNLSEWTTERTRNELAVIAGGSFGSEAQFQTADRTGGAVPNTRFNSYGFRIVRTVRSE